MGKRRKKGSGSIFQRSDGLWEGRVPIGYDKRGYPKTKNVVAKTKAECKKKFDARLSPQSVRNCYTLCKTSLEQAAV